MKKLFIGILVTILVLSSIGCDELPDLEVVKTEKVSEDESGIITESQTGTMTVNADAWSESTEKTLFEHDMDRKDAGNTMLFVSETEEIQDMEKSAATNQEQDRFGYGLIDTGLAYIRSEEPAFTEGISLCETYLYPAPAESMYELGVVYQGRKVGILKEIRAGIYDEFDMLTESEWYLVTADDLGSVGYIKKENIGNEKEVQVEAGAPWQIRAGLPYYFNSACTTPQSDDFPRGPLWIAGEDQENGIIALDGLSGFRAYINDMNVLESFMGLGRPRNSRAG